MKVIVQGRRLPLLCPSPRRPHDRRDKPGPSGGLGARGSRPRTMSSV
jgi:hypothetical protein